MFRPWQISLVAFKPWRLVRELGCYTDRECRGFMKAVAYWRIVFLIFALPVAMIFGTKLLALTELVHEAMFGRHDWTLISLTPGERAMGALYTFVIVAGSATAAFIPYAAMLRWVIRRRFISLACLKCRYSIVGLPVDNGCVKCPECGQDIRLEEHGWSAHDIIAGGGYVQRRIVVPRRPVLRVSVGAVLALIALALWVISGQAVWGEASVVAGVVTLLLGLPLDVRKE